MSQASQALPPDYYLQNFHVLLEQVQRQYEDLLLPQERRLCELFPTLCEDARKLYVRLLTRKGEVFRSSRLRYAEIQYMENAARELAAHGLIAIDPAVSLEQLLPLWSRQEWLTRLAALNLPTRGLAGLKRAELDFALAECLGGKADALLATDRLRLIAGESIYQLLNPNLFPVFKLLFFSNPYQDMTEFVLRDLGLYRFESYRLDRDTRLFRSRAQIEAHLSCHALAEHLDWVLLEDAATLLEFVRGLPPCPADDPALARRLQRLTYSLARQLERLGYLEDALKLYGELALPDAQERQVRVLVKLGREVDALTLCRERLQERDDTQHFAWRFGRRLARNAALDWPNRSAGKPAVEVLELEFTGDSVEFAVAEHYSARGECHYVENALLNSLFGLHYWPVIFAPVPGAFSHPFQHAPHDLHQAEFTLPRRDLLEERHAAVARMHENIGHYQTLWRDRFGCSNPFVYWQALDEAIIATALERIPATHWEAVFRRFWQDLKNNCSGLPDLILFPPEGGYELIEVKGPGDRLQLNQKAWMEYFARHGIPHRVVQVVWNHG